MLQTSGGQNSLHILEGFHSEICEVGGGQSNTFWERGVVYLRVVLNDFWGKQS